MGPQDDGSSPQQDGDLHDAPRGGAQGSDGLLFTFPHSIMYLLAASPPRGL